MIWRSKYWVFIHLLLLLKYFKLNFENPYEKHNKWDIWSWSTNIILKMQLKALLYLANIIKIMHIWADLFTRVLSLELRKLEWIWYIFQYSIFGVIYFQSTNSLLLFGDIDLELMKDQTLIIKVFKLMIHTRSPWILQNYSPS